MLFGLGAGLMNVPLTNAILDGAPAEQSGIASALLNASREVAGLLGVTVVGAVLRSREGSALRGGANPGQAFIDGYHSGLWLTIVLLAAGVVLSYLTLRPRRRVMLPLAGTPMPMTPETTSVGETTTAQQTTAVHQTTAVQQRTAVQHTTVAPRGQ